MSRVLLQRHLALAAAALLGTVIALALTRHVSHAGNHEQAAGQPVARSLAEWNRALAGVRTRARKRSACGWLLQSGTLGVGHPVLPCGARIFIAFHNKRVLTQVVDRGPRVPGYEFELTPALAKKMGLHGVQPIRWTFARG